MLLHLLYYYLVFSRFVRLLWDDVIRARRVCLPYLLELEGSLESTIQKTALMKRITPLLACVVPQDTMCVQIRHTPSIFEVHRTILPQKQLVCGESWVKFSIRKPHYLILIFNHLLFHNISYQKFSKFRCVTFLYMVVTLVKNSESTLVLLSLMWYPWECISL